MKFFLAFLGVLLLFFFGNTVSAQTNEDSATTYAYAVYCDSGVDRANYSDQMVEEAEDDDVMVLTVTGYQRLMETLGETEYNKHCGPGIRVLRPNAG